MEETLKRWLFDPLVGKLVFAVATLVVIYAIVRLLQRSIGRYVTDTDTRYRARKFVSFLGYLAAFLVLGAALSDRLGNLTVAFGVAGAGIAFALQEAIASVAGWVAISFGSFYSTGDRVQLGGIRGDVIDIGVLRTTLMELGQWVNGDLYNGRIVRIANSFVFKEPVFNYSADFPFLWDEVTFPVRYGSDWKYAIDMLQRVVDEVIGDYAVRSREAWRNVVRKYRIEDARIEPLITIRADENWIEYTVRYIVDYRRRRATKHEIFVRILEEVDKSAGRVGIATAGFELLSAPSLDVKLGEQPAKPALGSSQ
jgi:small-conductance mechanosensitive channel